LEFDRTKSSFSAGIRRGTRIELQFQDLKARKTASGSFTTTFNKARAAPEGLRNPCSQDSTVRSDTPNMAANVGRETFNCRLASITFGASSRVTRAGFNSPRWMATACCKLSSIFDTTSSRAAFFFMATSSIL
jgi:hypothetical protein